MSLGYMLVSPQDKEFFSVDWTDRFSSISAGTWVIYPTGPTLSGSTVIGGGTAGVYGTGFGAGTCYMLSSGVPSGDGQYEYRSIFIRCENGL